MVLPDTERFASVLSSFAWNHWPSLDVLMWAETAGVLTVMRALAQTWKWPLPSGPPN